MTAEPLVRADGLVRHFTVNGRAVRAVDGVSFDIARGETLALVGESGCGKTTTGRMLVRLVEPDAGTVRFDGAAMTGLSGAALRAARQRMQLVFQDPGSSFNPRMSVASIVEEPMLLAGVPRAERRRRVAELLPLVGLPDAYAARFPHEFSGGQRQRIGIARALALRPDFIVCDEPVSALDVSIQAQVVNLLTELQRQFGLTFLFISHDLRVVRHVATRVAVMYGGRIVEVADKAALFCAPPLHPRPAGRRAVPPPRRVAARPGTRHGRDTGRRRHTPRLPLPPALPARGGRVPDRRPGPAARGRRARGRRTRGRVPPDRPPARLNPSRRTRHHGPATRHHPPALHHCHGRRRHAAEAGRDPDGVKVLFLANPLIDTTMDAARERRTMLRAGAERHLDMALANMSRLTNIDFSRFELDEPLPELETNGHQSSLSKWIGKTPRTLALAQNAKMGIDFTGTPAHVAGMMAEIMEEVGGDGFLFFNAAFDRRYVMEVCDGLVPELQRRGVTRKAYAHKHLRDNLMEF